MKMNKSAASQVTTPKCLDGHHQRQVSIVSSVALNTMAAFESPHPLGEQRLVQFRRCRPRMNKTHSHITIVGLLVVMVLVCRVISHTCRPRRMCYILIFWRWVNETQYIYMYEFSVVCRTAAAQNSCVATVAGTFGRCSAQFGHSRKTAACVWLITQILCQQTTRALLLVLVVCLNTAYCLLKK